MKVLASDRKGRVWAGKDFLTPEKEFLDGPVRWLSC